MAEVGGAPGVSLTVIKCKAFRQYKSPSTKGGV